LISAYDIYKDYLTIESAYASDIIFIDSGGYENKITPEPLEAYYDPRIATKWNFDFYEEIICQLENFADITIISYDEINNIPLQEQIDKAFYLYEKYYEFGIDFLWKPDPGELFYSNPHCLVHYIDIIRNFRCLGVTDKELGGSLMDRCNRLVQIRTMLSNHNCDIPIHVFGCLDPLNSFLFFLCGADVFDGLSWLRYSFINNTGIYMEQFSLITGNYELSDEDIRANIWIYNLNILNKLQKIMKKYATSFNPEDIHLLSKEQRDSLRSILKKIQISSEGAL